MSVCASATTGRAIMRARGGHLTRDMERNGIVYRVHKLVDLSLRLVKLTEYGMLHYRLVKVVYTLLNYVNKFDVNKSIWVFKDEKVSGDKKLTYDENIICKIYEDKYSIK